MDSYIKAAKLGTNVVGKAASGIKDTVVAIDRDVPVLKYAILGVVGYGIYSVYDTTNRVISGPLAAINNAERQIDVAINQAAMQAARLEQEALVIVDEAQRQSQEARSIATDAVNAGRAAVSGLANTASNAADAITSLLGF